MTLDQHWPIEYASQVILSNPGSNVAICCLWSKREQIASSLDPSNYCIVGNLYSRAGINAMLRNILANPLIRYIVLTGNSVTDSDDALHKFFTLGVNQEWKIIGNGGKIDQSFPHNVLEEIRNSVRLIDLRGIRNFRTEFEKIFKKLSTLPPFAEPRLFPKTTPSQHIYPSEFIGFVVRHNSIVEAWKEILWTIITFGEISPTDYGLEQREILGLLSIIQNPRARPKTIPNWAPFTITDVEVYVEDFFRAQKGREVAYSYGDRLSSYWGSNQIDSIIAELRRSKYSRRAEATLWDPRSDPMLLDPPCISLVQAAIRHEQLYLTAYIRSNDMYRAYPLNAFALAALQMRITSALGDVEIGPLSILSFSAHIYSDCWEACQKAASELAKLKNAFQPDPRGSFVLAFDNGEFLADHFSPRGDLVQTLTARSEKDLRRVIMPFVGRIDHAVYLGRESYRLGLALKNGKNYEQDRIEIE
jgi:thymidylate synthase